MAVSTKGELDETIGWAQDSGELAVIGVKIPRDDISQQLAWIGLEVARRRGWKWHQPAGRSARLCIRRTSRRQLELVVNPASSPRKGTSLAPKISAHFYGFSRSDLLDSPFFSKSK